MTRYSELLQEPAPKEAQGETPYDRLLKMGVKPVNFHGTPHRDDPLTGPPPGARTEPRAAPLTYGEELKAKTGYVARGLAQLPAALLGLAEIKARFSFNPAAAEGYGKARETVADAGGLFGAEVAGMDRQLEGAGTIERAASRGIPQGLGSAASMLAGGAAAGGSRAAIAGTGAIVEATAGYYEAKAAGAGEDKAAMAFAAGLPLGALEAFGIGRALGAANKATGGAVMQRIVREALREGGEEVVQEIVQTVGGNLAAQGLYDPERGLLEGVPEAALSAAVLGTGIGGAAGGMQGQVDGAAETAEATPVLGVENAATHTGMPQEAGSTARPGASALEPTTPPPPAVAAIEQPISLGAGAAPATTTEAPAAEAQVGGGVVPAPGSLEELHEIAQGASLIREERRWTDAVTTPDSRVRHDAGWVGKVIEGAEDPVNGEGRAGMALVEHDGKQEWVSALKLSPAFGRETEIEPPPLTVESQKAAASEAVELDPEVTPEEVAAEVARMEAEEAVAKLPTEPGLFGKQKRPPKPRKEGAPVKVTQPNLIDVQPGDQRGQQTIESLAEAPAKKKVKRTPGKRYPSGSVGEPRSVVDFVVEAGGIDLRKGFTDQHGRKGGEFGDLWERLRKKEAGRQIPGLIYGPESKAKGQGLTPDDMTQALEGFGFRGEDGGRPTLNDLIDWLNDEVQHDTPHYHPDMAPLPEQTGDEWRRLEGNWDVVKQFSGKPILEAFSFPPPLFDGLERTTAEKKPGQLVGPESTLDAARRVAQDKFIRVQRAREATGDTREQTDAPGHIELFEGKVEEHIRKGEDRFIEPIKRLAAGSGIELFHDADAPVAASEKPALDLYLLARGAAERNAVISERTKGAITADAGIDTQTAAAIVKAAESGPQGEVYKDLGQRFDTLNRRALDIGRRTGLISQEQIDAYRKTFGEHYAPRRTNVEGGAGAKGRGFGVPKADLHKRAGGRESLPDSPLVFALMQYNQAAVLGEKNVVSESLAKLIEENPAPGYWRVRQADKPSTEGFESKPDTTIPFKRNGVPYVIETSDPLLARAMLNLGASNSGRLIGGIGKVMRVLAMTRTTLSPEFIARNLVKDSQTAFVNMSGERGFKAAGKMLARTGKSIRAVYRVLSDDTAKGEMEDAYRRLRDAGGTVGWFTTPTYDELATRIEKDLSALKKGPASSRTIYGALRAAGEWIEMANRAVENGIRLSAFVEAEKAGMSQFAAARLSKNLTVNFNKKGEWGTVANALWMFSNAGIQSSIRQAKAIAGSRKVQAVLGAAVVMGAAESILNRMIGGVDDDGEDEYDKLAEFIKRGNVILMAPPGSKLEEIAKSLPEMFGAKTESGGWYLKIPKPYGYGLFHDFGRQIADVVAGQREPSEAASSFAAGAWNDLFPFGSTMPTLMEPAFEIARNRKYGDRPIHPEEFPGEVTSDAANFFDSASKPSREAAKFLNSLGIPGIKEGGDELRSGPLDFHPDTLDYLVKWLTGGTGTFALNTKKVADSLQGKQKLEANDIPFWRTFVGAPYAGWTRERFYDNLRLYDEAKARQKKGLELSDFERAILAEAAFKGARNHAKKLRDAEDQAALDTYMERINRLVFDLKAPKKP